MGSGTISIDDLGEEFPLCSVDIYQARTLYVPDADWVLDIVPEIQR